MVACLFAAPSKKYKLVVKTTNSEYSYALYKQPEISFTNTDMVIKMDQEDVRFAKSDIVEFLFDYNQYKVTFLDWDGDTLQSSMVTYGEYPSYTGETPIREADAQYTYTFSGWSPEITIVVAEAEYTAQYDATDKVTTTIENTQSNEEKPYKVFYDDKIFIIRGDKVYSILGNVIED
jgi:hypothetical protein